MPTPGQYAGVAEGVRVGRPQPAAGTDRIKDLSE